MMFFSEAVSRSRFPFPLILRGRQRRRIILSLSKDRRARGNARRAGPRSFEASLRSAPQDEGGALQSVKIGTYGDRRRA
ncbi:hypothetical protein D8666_04905 [Ochrobactrum soli]|nr:hypothetical protein D8666_04905 [[Ochrobactrum] soli]